MSIKKKLMSMDESIVMNKGFSSKGISEKEESEPEEEGEEKEYPYCLRIYLGPEELDKLSLKELPKLGTMLNMQAQVKVIGLRENEDGKNLEIQIVAMDLQQGKEKVSTEKMLYNSED